MAKMFGYDAKLTIPGVGTFPVVSQEFDRAARTFWIDLGPILRPQSELDTDLECWHQDAEDTVIE
jgi:hypothetical protein